MVADVVGVENRDRIFCNWLDDRDNVYFLHAKLTHAEWPTVLIKHAIRPLNLTGKKERWRRVQPCSRDPGHSVGATRPGCNHADAQMIGGFGIALGANGTGL